MAEEIELLNLVFYLQEYSMSLVQWWASISFAVILAGHFTAPRANLPILLTLLFAYTLFTYLILRTINDYGTWLISASQDYLSFTGQHSLEQLKTNAERLYSSGGASVPLTFTFYVTYLLTVGYVIYSFRISFKKSRHKNGRADS